MALEQHMDSEHQETEVIPRIDIKSDDSKDPEESKEVRLNYVLNELKNVKVAKVNAKKDMAVKRIEVNEVNTRYELNSALFLVMKEEMIELKPNRKFYDESTQVWMEVESVVKQMDKGKNNPASVIKWKINDKKKNWESKVTMVLYHTNQGVHFQGGNRNGAVSSCSLAANFFESYCNNLRLKKGQRIQDIKEVLLKLDARKNYGSHTVKHKQSKKQEANTELKCDSCHYKTVLKPELKRHMFTMHRNKVNATSMKSHFNKATIET